MKDDQVAATDLNDRLDCDNDVRAVIQREDLASLERAAEWIAASGADVINLQHEFGLWGGFDGAFVVPFLERVQVLVLAVLHTVPFNAHAFDRAGRLELLGEIVRRSTHLVTFLPVAREFLIERYGLDPARVSVLWHGAPAYPPLDRLAAKQELGLEGRTILTTLGLLNRFKGIDDALQALAELVAEEPALVYLVLGRPHPAEPASLVPNLRRLADGLGLGNHVRFVDHYLTEEEIQCYLAATDVYLAPYHDLSQTSSGTLTRALAAGRTAVATPFPLALAALADGRGALAPPRDPSALAAALRPLVTDPALRAAYERRAREHGARGVEGGDDEAQPRARTRQGEGEAPRATANFQHAPRSLAPGHVEPERLIAYVLAARLEIIVLWMGIDLLDRHRRSPPPPTTKGALDARTAQCWPRPAARGFLCPG